jgi:hypothetical protein
MLYETLKWPQIAPFCISSKIIMACTLLSFIYAPGCLIFYRKWKNKIKRWTMHWSFGLKMREQFTVSAFSLTLWQILLHIVIHVYWNTSGLIQTDATKDIVVNSFLAWLITESITMHSVHLTFQCSKVYRLHINTQLPYSTQNQDNSFNFRFQNWERSTIEKTTCKHGESSSFPLFFFNKTRIGIFF